MEYWVIKNLRLKDFLTSFLKLIIPSFQSSNVPDFLGMLYALCSLRAVRRPRQAFTQMPQM